MGLCFHFRFASAVPFSIFIHFIRFWENLLKVYHKLLKSFPHNAKYTCKQMNAVVKIH